MKGKWVWIIIVLIVIVAGLWWSGVFGSMSNANSQPAATASAVTPVAAGVSAAATNSIANIDTQIVANASDIDVQAKTPTLEGENAIVDRFGMVANAMTNLTPALQASIIAAQKAGKPVTALNTAAGDMKTQVSNALAIVLTVKKNLSGLKPANASANALILKQSAAQLQSAHAYIQTARTDIQTVVKGTI